MINKYWVLKLGIYLSSITYVLKINLAFYARSSEYKENNWKQSFAMLLITYNKFNKFFNRSELKTK